MLLPEEVSDQLIDGVLAFANLDTPRPDRVAECFEGMWRPKSLPQAAGCRAVQREVRQWLAEKWFEDPVTAFFGGTKKGFTDARIEFLGRPGFEIYWKDDNLHQNITFHWWVTKGSLRSICGFAVAVLYDRSLIDHVGICAREGCGRYFVDRRSRGQRREYCLTDECSAIRNRQRVAASRPSRKAK